MTTKIALDAGHSLDTYEKTGGKGIIYDGGVFEEHEFNATVVKYTQELLETNGFEVLLTQPLFDDEVPLIDRTNLANKEKVDLLISIHANAGILNANGACAFYWHNSNEGKRLAKVWANKMKGSPVGIHGTGVHESKPNSWSDFHMIRETNMTAVLCEHGFFTNHHDLKYILSDEFRRNCALILAESICEFFNKTFKKSQQSNTNKQDELPSIQRKVNGMLNGERIWIDSYIINNSTYVPLRFLTESFGMEVKWDQSKFQYNIIQKSPTFNDLSKS
ncbi:N-acetylmuramoyl-L-alanine amidase [Chengkuizengella sp. SCS-71B]|uniref:N-acetylmuramoyl-L-alanine amidase n=1 Tax=Chengkuizengella sp. SCS-71B TaxID=3115290 RepID=UPI0032C24B81